MPVNDPGENMDEPVIRHLSMLVCVRVGDTVPLMGGDKATIVGKLGSDVIGSVNNTSELIKVTGTHLED